MVGELVASALANLGLFGNSLIQLAACDILAREKHGLELTVPERWFSKFGKHLACSEDLRVLEDAAALSLDVVADRVVISHPGFKAWISTLPQYRALCVSLGVEQLSGKQLRKHFPQVSSEDFSPSASSPSVPLAGKALWGYFQFHSSVFAPYQPRIRHLFTLKHEAEYRRLVDEQRAMYKGRFVVVHVRKGDFSDILDPDATPATAEERTLRTEPPFEEGQGEAWEDPSGVAFRTPLSYIEECLDSLSITEDDLLWLCTDDPSLGKEPSLGRFQDVYSWSAPPRPLTTLPAEVDPMLLDWFTLSCADVLLISNSTFSYTAAWRVEKGAQTYRPDPRASGFVKFDPWSSLILLPSADVPANHSLHVKK